MQVAIALLVLLAAASAFGSFIKQGQTYAWYEATYSTTRAGWIMALGLNDVYHSPWYIAIAAFLCLNLLFCNLVRLPSLVKRFKDMGAAPKQFSLKEGGYIADEKGVASFFKACGFVKTEEGTLADGRKVISSVRGRIGIFGAWVTHFGILLLILGFGLGQMLKEEYTVYGVPGSSMAIGETGYILTIDDFRIGLREDDTVNQYTADITVRKADGSEKESAEISVNNPGSLFGMKFFQNSTGWAAQIHVKENGVPLQDELIYAGEYITVSDKQDLAIYLNAFYPDYVLDPVNGPMSKSSAVNNPAYLYSVYYQGQILGMNALLESEMLTIDEYTVTFSDPQSYSLIQVKRDPYTPLALLGGLLTMAGLMLAFYVQVQVMTAVREEDGSWHVYGSSPKGGVLFEEKLAREAEQLGIKRAEGSSGSSKAEDHSGSSKAEDHSGSSKAEDQAASSKAEGCSDKSEAEAGTDIHEEEKEG